MHAASLTPAAAPQPVTARQWRHGQWKEIEEVASREQRLLVEYPGGQCSLWAWPHDLAPLALGHVLLDRLHSGPEDAPTQPRSGHVEIAVAQNGECRARVRLDAPLAETATAALSGDGASAHAAFPPVAPAMDCGAAPAAAFSALMEHVMNLPGMWSGTGCFHRAAMVHLTSGRVALMSEDIGRHNCLDRLMGQAMLTGLHPAEHALFISARITASLYCKARRAGFACLVSRAAVTSASLERAAAQGVTLVGFCRSAEQRLTVFADQAGRVLP